MPSVISLKGSIGLPRKSEHFTYFHRIPVIFIDFPDFYNSLFLVRNHILEAQEHVNNHNRDFLIWDCFELDGARQSLVGWQPPRSGEFLPGNPHTHMGGASPPPSNQNLRCQRNGLDGVWSWYFCQIPSPTLHRPWNTMPRGVFQHDRRIPDCLPPFSSRGP